MQDVVVQGVSKNVPSKEAALLSLNVCFPPLEVCVDVNEPNRKIRIHMKLRIQCGRPHAKAVLLRWSRLT